MANDNIFQQYLIPPKSVMEYTAEMDQADARKQSLKQNALTLAAGQQASQRAEQLRTALGGLPQGATDVQRIQAMRGTATPEGFAAADALDKSLTERRKGNAAAAKDEADTAKLNLARDAALHGFHAQRLATVQSPEDALAWAQEGNALGLFKQPGQYDRGIAAIQQAALDPQTFAQWKAAAMQGGQSVTEQLNQQIEQMKHLEQVRQFGVKQTTPDANTVASNLQSDKNNHRTVGASYANASATREIAKATRDAASIRRDQETEMKLGDDYRKQSKDFKDVGDAYRQIQATLDKATTSPAATLAGATKFMKLLDPGSVVRESELGMALAATGAFDRAANYVESLKYGKVLTPNQVKDFKNITAQIYKAAQTGQQQIDASYSKQAKTYNLRPEMIVQDLGQNPPAGGNDVMSAADAILKGGK
jgi:hypothetical protein